jgi:hypothetical protein
VVCIPRQKHTVISSVNACPIIWHHISIVNFARHVNVPLQIDLEWQLPALFSETH